ncbi:MAG: Lipid A biosynthesis lauroyltransferase [Chlamydiia bacterium]|nr:Lipid A biosynthesis lauroyltransferase [Chlamydiia bacterium]MCH9615822.1 Lipid A biosynthesis lauroyltransferase [Chlamydiia bacterium]MCH9628775.1 Lipid A biosynthesis lauroyltransferase [Chlamydiia bacterium]
MLVYLLIRLVTLPFALLPLRAIHCVGNLFGKIAYYLVPKFRKRALSNITFALDLPFPKAKKIAIASFQNLMITALEYPKFAFKKDLSKLIVCENPEVAKQIIDQKRGIVFFVGHQANWEVLFLDGTTRMPGVAIGRPIKNIHLYNWVKRIREKNGGTIVPPKNALKEGLRALKSGKFLGIVGDQGMPGDNAYESTFLGKRAYTSPAPALLAYKTNCPIITATIKRLPGKYLIHYSDPIYPDSNALIDTEMPRLMNTALTYFEDSVRKNPGQWLWQHNRWKQETPATVYYKYRHDQILIIADDPLDLSIFRTIYPKAFITLLTTRPNPTLRDTDQLIYKRPEDTLLNDHRFKLVFNLTTNPHIDAHYKKLSAFEVLNLDPNSFETTLKQEVCRAP